MNDQEKKAVQELANIAVKIAETALANIEHQRGYGKAVGRVASVILADALAERRKQKQDPNQPDPDF